MHVCHVVALWELFCRLAHSVPINCTEIPYSVRFSYMHAAFGSRIQEWDSIFPVGCTDSTKVAALSLPPILISNAEHDEGLEEDTARLIALLRSADQDVEAITIAGTNHASIWNGLAIAGDRSHEVLLPKIVSCFKKVFGAQYLPRV